MRYSHLQLSHMATFVTVAKSMSFTLASEELCLTQGAISHRISSLEQALGFKLFIRLTRRLELTEEGERLLATLTSAFRLIDEEMDALAHNELSGELYIGIAPTFGLSWLMPRLEDFKACYPNLNLRLRVKASKLDFQHEPVDMAIYYGDGQNPGFYQLRLFDEWLTPALSPHYAEQLNLAANKEHIFAEASLIHCIESLDTLSYTNEWQTWQQKTGFEINFEHQRTIINHAEMAISSARNNMGIMMGRLALIRPHLRTRELITPFPLIKSGLGYDLICPAGLEHRPRYRAFIEWMQKQAAMEQALNTSLIELQPLIPL